MRIVLDNSQGADPRFVSDLQDAFTAADHAVEVRPPTPQSMYDTTVHFIVEGVAIRVPDDASRDAVDGVTTIVRAVLQQRGERQRFRAVPVYRGETNQVLAWVDVFD